MEAHLTHHSSMNQLRTDAATMDALGRAMYQIRAPQKSQRVPYEHLSTGQKNANQNTAIEIIVSASGAGSANVDETIEDLAKLFYSRLAPRKSELQPWNTRSDYHHSWYRSQATSFLLILRDSLDANVGTSLNSASGERLGSPSATLLGQTTVLERTGQMEQAQNYVISGRELESLRLESGESLAQLGDERIDSVGANAHFADSADGTPSAQALPPVPQGGLASLALPLYVIAGLLVVLILVLVLL